MKNKKRLFACVGSILACVLLVVVFAIPCFAMTEQESTILQAYGVTTDDLSYTILTEIRDIEVIDTLVEFGVPYYRANTNHSTQPIYFPAIVGWSNYSDIPLSWYLMDVNGNKFNGDTISIVSSSSQITIELFLTADVYIQLVFNLSTTTGVNGTYIATQSRTSYVGFADAGLVAGDTTARFALYTLISSPAIARSTLDYLYQFKARETNTIAYRDLKIFPNAYCKGLDNAGGYDDGYQIGYNEGYSAGETAGYNSGYSSGYDVGANENFGESILGDTFRNVSLAVNEIVLFEYKGLDGEMHPFTLGGVLGAVIGVGIFFAFLKIFAGG